MSRVELYSPHAPDECAARLAAAIDRPGIWEFFFGTKPVLGLASPARVRLMKRLSRGFHNSFQSVLVCRLRRHDGGTVLRGRVGMHRFVVAVLCLMAGFFLFIDVSIVVSMCRGGKFTGGVGTFLLFQVGLAFLCGVPAVGRWLARGEDRFLTEFLARVVDGRSADRTGVKCPGG